MRDLHRRACGTIESCHQEPRPRASELLDDLELIGVRRHRRPSAGILLSFAGGHKPQEQLPGRLLVGGRECIEGALRGDPDGFPHPARSRVGISGQPISFPPIPRSLESVLQERQHALVRAGVVEDPLQQSWRIEREADHPEATCALAILSADLAPSIAAQSFIKARRFSSFGPR